MPPPAPVQRDWRAARAEVSPPPGTGPIRKVQYCMRGGLQRHLLGDAGRWQPPLWIYAVVAVVIYFPAAAELADCWPWSSRGPRLSYSATSTALGAVLPAHRRPGRHTRKALGEGLLTDIRLHDLRHTHATLLLADGVPVKVVLEPIRHASATITLSAYQHAYPGMGLQVAHRFAALLEG